MFTQRKRF